MKKEKCCETPITEQKFYLTKGDSQLGATNAVPRTTEFDLQPSWKDEGTFGVVKRGNQP